MVKCIRMKQGLWATPDDEFCSKTSRSICTNGSFQNPTSSSSCQVFAYFAALANLICRLSALNALKRLQLIKQSSVCAIVVLLIVLIMRDNDFIHGLHMLLFDSNHSNTCERLFLMVLTSNLISFSTIFMCICIETKLTTLGSINLGIRILMTIFSPISVALSIPSKMTVTPSTKPPVGLLMIPRRPLPIPLKKPFKPPSWAPLMGLVKTPDSPIMMPWNMRTNLFLMFYRGLMHWIPRETGGTQTQDCYTVCGPVQISIYKTDTRRKFCRS